MRTAYCAAKHEMSEWIYPLMARRGDLVVLEESGRLIAGLVHLEYGRHLVCAGEKGLHRLPITDIKRAWHVGPKGLHRIGVPTDGSMSEGTHGGEALAGARPRSWAPLA